MEAIDPVAATFSNHSSGKMGYALAACSQARGGECYACISGPVR